MIGLILQLVSFLTFCAIFIVFLVRLRSRYPSKWEDRQWRPLVWALLVSSTGVIVSLTPVQAESMRSVASVQIRSVFRTVENSQGFHGYLSVHEGYFWALDALPLAVAVGMLVPFWPPRILRSFTMGVQTNAVSMESVSSKR